MHINTLFFKSLPAALVVLGMCSCRAAQADQPEVTVAKYLGNRQAAVSLTFDDGLEEHYTLIAPELDRYGLKGTFGIIGKFIGDRYVNYYVS